MWTAGVVRKARGEKAGVGVGLCGDYADDFAAAVHQVQQAGVSVYAAHLRGKNSYACQDYTKGTAFLIGNEGNGLREETAELADCYIRIPMEGKVESLNAAVASSILMYEAHRQRAI